MNKMMAVFGIVAMQLAALATGNAAEIAVYTSSAAGDRLAQKAPLKFSAAGKGQAATFKIDDSKPLQKILGFGATFQEAGSIVLSSLPEREQEDVLRAMFDPEQGAGYTAMVTYMGSTDYQSAGPYFTYADTPGDVEMKNFSIQRDLGPNGLVTYIKRAQKYGSFILHARQDYPPNWMLLDSRFEKGMILDPQYYSALAKYYLRYVEEYRKQGIDINYLSLFNEPGFYTKISYSEIGDLIGQHVGPLFEQAGVKTKLQVADAPFRTWAVKAYPVILDNPRNRKYIGSISYHAYDFLFGPEAEKDALRQLSQLHQRYPDVPMWLTEHCYHRDSIMYLGLGDMELPRLDFEDGDFWGRQIAAELEAGASAWSYFNAILDENGGPNFESEAVHLYKKENVQHAVIVIDRQTKQVHYTGLYYYLAHFSKFVRPQSVRLTSSGSADGVRLLAFKRPDNKVVTQVINSRKEDARVHVEWRGRKVELKLPATSISTYIWDSSAAT